MYVRSSNNTPVAEDNKTDVHVISFSVSVPFSASHVLQYMVSGLVNGKIFMVSPLRFLLLFIFSLFLPAFSMSVNS